MEREKFQTKDLYLASFLLACGARLERVDRSNPRRVQFEFRGVDPALIAAYWRGEAIRRVKSLIFKDIAWEAS